MPAEFKMLSPHDLKALLRERYGSIRKFQSAHGLPVTAVANLLRGKGYSRIVATVEFAVRDAVFHHDRGPLSRRRRVAAARADARAELEALFDRARDAVNDPDRIMFRARSKAVSPAHRLIAKGN